MDSIDNKHLQLIFKYLNLKERTSIRMVNKRFKNLCDSILIDKLIIFNNKPPVAGKLEYINELYTELDCVYVENLYEFFKNQFIQKLLNSLRVLKIISSENENSFRISTKLNNLIYLSIENLNLIKFELFGSPKIEYLIIDNILYDKENARLDYQLLSRPIDPRIFVSGFMYLKSRNLKYLKIHLSTDKDFYNYLLNNNLVNNLEHLNCVLDDFKTLEYLNESFIKLKRIDCLIKSNLNELITEINEIDIKSVASKLRKNLKVYLFGVLFNESSVGFMNEFLSSLSYNNPNCIMVNSSELIYRFTTKSLRLLKNNAENSNLKEFYKLFTSIHLTKRNQYDKNLFEKFVNCNHLVYLLDDESVSREHFEKVIQIYKLNQISICTYNVRNSFLDNKKLDLIPKYQNQLNVLIFESFEKINFDFLFKLTKLTHLSAILCYPIDQTVFLDLIKQIKYLRFINMTFFRTDDITTEYLSNFKKCVIKYYEEELNLKKFDFKIQIYTKKEIQFIKLCLSLKSNLKIKDPIKDSSNSLNNRYFELYDYLKKNKFNK